MKRTPKSITIHEVADAAGVSVSTVSRVLNEKVDVASDTYERVQQTIRELGYESSLAARGMRSHQTHVIGLVLPDVATPYCIEVVRAINHVIAHSEYDMLIFTKGDTHKYDTTDQGRRHVLLLNGNVADGIIVVAPPDFEFTSVSNLVMIDPSNMNFNCPGIISTNQEGAMDVVRYLVALGHRRIAHIAGRLELVSGRQRLQGYKDGLAAAGIKMDETLIRVGDFTDDMGYVCAWELFALDNPPTAIFAASDTTAVGVYRAAYERGLRIPQDVSVVGFDNLSDLIHLNPPLTTVDQSVAEMGRLAAETVLRLVKGDVIVNNQLVIPTKMVIRDSCTLCRCVAAVPAH